jgi:molecular chaperone DnaK
VPKIEVVFEVDANGILSVSARDLGTGNEQTVRVRPTGGLTERDIERMLKEADANRQADSLKRELASLRVKSDGLIYTTERSLAEFMTYLTDEEVQQIHQDLDRCKAASESNDLEGLKSAIRHLEQSAYRIAEVMYKDVS